MGFQKNQKSEVLHIASCSFGKDSIATILLALEHGEPLDFAIFCEVMYDAENNISGEHPEHIEWIKDVAIPKLENLGCPVKILSESDYLSEFYHRNTKGKRIGSMRGFPIAGRCVINRTCKLQPIKHFLKAHPNVVQYVGIAIDEPERLARLKKGKISLLAKYGYTESMAKELAARYGLLSPLYSTSNRGGCWFCPNASPSQFCELRRKHPDLWERLKELSKTPKLVSKAFRYNETLEQIERKMDVLDFYDRNQLTLF